ncbi:ribonuclease H-like domain-containing protein [Jimgerdemannia flammicorona]|uniref:Ribonuclease H-like domain-containing protein n=1 Tax=Jimgerdemannia flammicorona TaxID=994334 RepID=A0A433D5D5_9FUNG|nr:ribonuclease H-like domain-containing protein [Jimgerdemannia flammicorona]
MASHFYNDITRENILQMALAINHILDKASFISIDTEFTGLGGKGYDTRAPLVKSHALVAVGLTSFERISNSWSDDAQQKWGTQYVAQNFSFLLSCQTEYTVNPSSLSFLIESGFDFNKQIKLGIPYYCGSDPLPSMQDPSHPPKRTLTTSLRNIFSHLLRLSRTRRVPIIIHNGLLDLMFLYHAFHTDLPTELSAFVADLSEMFPAGIYDTKYVADYVTRERSSFLAYLFRKYEREQMRRQHETLSVDVIVGEHEAEGVTHAGVPDGIKTASRVPKEAATVKRQRWFIVDIKDSLAVPLASMRALDGEDVHDNTNMLKRGKNGNEKGSIANNGGQKEKLYCEQYALHGFCRKNKQCGKSHDLDLILDEEEAAQHGRKRQKLDDSGGLDNRMFIGTTSDSEHRKMVDDMQHNVVSSMHSTKEMPNPTSVTSSSSSYHSAHFDSYMTGFIFAHQLTEYGEMAMCDKHRNRLYLIGKDLPLRVEKSQFATISKGHDQVKKGWQD